MKSVLALTSVLLLGACATTEPLAFNSPSGKPDVTFPNQSTAEVSGKITSLCLDTGYIVVSTTPHEVVCKGRMGSTQSILFSALLMPRNATPPEPYVRYTLAPVAPNVRVQAYAWVESTTAFGQKQTFELTNPSLLNGVYNGLRHLAALSPPSPSQVTPAAPVPTPVASTGATSPAPAAAKRSTHCGPVEVIGPGSIDCYGR